MNIRRASTAAATDEQSKSDWAGCPSVLVVEHEIPVARALQSSLVRFGYDVTATVASAAAALEAVETFEPDLVLMDVRLEEAHDGIAAANAIRARYPTPIVFLSGQSDEETLARAKEAQPHGYVLKPYQDGELRAAIDLAMQRHMLEERTSQERSLLAGVLGGMTDAVVAADVSGRVVLANDAGRRVFGVGQGPDVSPVRFVLKADRETPWPEEELPLVRALRGEMVRDVELFVQTADAPEGRWYSVNATPLLGAEGLVCGAVAVARDVTELRAMRGELERLAQTDALTGTYNRGGFMQAARGAFDDARKYGRQPALFFVDLNGMKHINDSLGHPEGDRLLLDVATILRRCFRTSDVIGRLGGDEFVVLAPDAGECADALQTRLRTAVDRFNAEGERPYRISISVGLSKAEPETSSGLEDLIEQADKRMYADKMKRRRRAK